MTTKRLVFRLYRGQRGFTLLEVLIAAAIISAIGTGVIRAIDTNARVRQSLDERVQATNLVTAYLEGIRQLPYSDSASPYASVDSSVIKPPQYVVSMDIVYGHSADGINIIWTADSNGGAYKLQKITISVSREGGKPVLSACTFRTLRTK